MEKLSPLKIKMDGYELIETRVINVFKNAFDLYIDNVEFHFAFIEDENVSSFAKMNKTSIIEGKDVCIYNLKIYNFNTKKAQGWFEPIEFGQIDNDNYYFTLAGIDADKDEHKNEGKIISLNIFRKPMR